MILAGKKWFVPCALTCRPRHAVNVGEYARGHSAAVVAAPPNQHHAQLGNLGLGLENVALLDGRHTRAAIGGHGDAGGLVCVIARNNAIGNGYVGGVDGEGRTEHQGQVKLSCEGNAPIKRGGSAFLLLLDAAAADDCLLSMCGCQGGIRGQVMTRKDLTL